MVELLAPAGDLEKLKFAILYGADAVYVGGEFFGLRARAGNFSVEELKEGADFVHSRKKKLYLTLNIIPHDEELEGLKEYLLQIQDIVDAVIVSDPGAMSIVKGILPKMEIHLSTQANTTNSFSAKFWYDMGVKRIVLARELSFEEIRNMRANIPEELELEAFIHGAMCMAYSGRCFLSSYMTGRNSNAGDCAQPCRWSYKLVEEKRPDDAYPIVETDKGSYILNSKDLCMIDHMSQVIQSGLSSLKIEGRMKTVYYVASVVRVYREAIDAYYEAVNRGEEFVTNPAWREELLKTGNRGYTTGFYFGNPMEDAQRYESAATTREYDFVGIVRGYDEENGLVEIEQRNHFKVGQELEVIGPEYFEDTFVVDKMYDEKYRDIQVAPHAQMTVYLPHAPLPVYSLLRHKRGNA